MEYRPIEVKLMGGKDLKDVNVFSTMDVYVVGSVSGDPRSMQQTAVHKDGGINPTWNHVMRFNVDESAARLNRLGLVFQIMSNRTLGDKEVGRVYVPLKELYDAFGEYVDLDDTGEFCICGQEKHIVYQVQTSTGRFKGQLEFSYKFGEKFTYTFDQKLDTGDLPLDRGTNNEPVFPSGQKHEDEPVMAYPVGPGSIKPGPGAVPMPGPNHYPGVGVEGSSSYGYGGMTPPPTAYPQQGYGYGYGYGYPGHQPPPPPTPPNAHMGYGYGYPAGGYGYPGQPSTGFAQQPVKPPKKKGNKFGLGTATAGLGAGLLGGLLVGEMVQDVAQAAVYDDDDMYDF